MMSRRHLPTTLVNYSPQQHHHHHHHHHLHHHQQQHRLQHQQQQQPMATTTATVVIPAMSFSLHTFVVLLMTLLIVAGNVLILLVLLKTDMLSLINRYFLMSLTVSDLCIGLFVAPFSFWTSLFDRWIYGEEFCHIEAYMAAIFWIASVYSLSWLSIDHYVAIRKPDRHERIMTRTRCMCWVALIWIGAISFCSPPVFGISDAHYVPEAYVCMIDWNLQKAYFVTSGLLIVVPPLAALAVTNLYVFTANYQQNKIVYEQCTEINARPDMYVMNVVIGGVYVISWLPLCSLQLYEAIRVGSGQGQSPIPPQVQFWIVWLAIGNSFWKFPVYVLCSHDFRTGLRMLYANSACPGCCCC